MENKRKEERVLPHVLEPVEVQVMGDGFLEILSAKDIGPGGIGIYVSHGFQGLNIVREVEVILSIPNEDSFKARGVIKYKRQLYNPDDQREFYGILFTQIAAQHRDLLEKYVERRLADKRLHVRVGPDAGNPVEVSIIGENGPRPVQVRDISAGGIRICKKGAGNGLSSLREIDFRLALPAGEAFQLKGSLKYELETENCAGICFEGLTEGQQEAITDYILARVREIQKRI